MRARLHDVQRCRPFPLAGVAGILPVITRRSKRRGPIVVAPADRQVGDEQPKKTKPVEVHEFLGPLAPKSVKIRVSLVVWFRTMAYLNGQEFVLNYSPYLSE